jgi:predicted nucleic acid-binding protein
LGGEFGRKPKRPLSPVILVDSSVWIDHLRNTITAPVSHLRALISREELLVGDLILCEVLQGLRTDAEVRLVEDALREFEVVALVDAELAVKAAENYRLLRRRGITISKTIDLLIGTYCIERRHALLHSDHDFEPMERFLGLQTA